MLTTVEKVIFLQEIDVFKHLTTEDLAHIALISEEQEIPDGFEIFKENGLPDSMYLILEGRIRLHKDGKDVMTAGKNDAIGTWALFDDQPRIVTAETIEPCRLLRIDTNDFIDVLADNVRVTQGILKALVYRVRGLMTRVS